MNPYLKIKKYFLLRTINKQIKRQILITKIQRILAKSNTEKMSIENQFKAAVIVGFFPAKFILRNMLQHRRRIIKSLNK